VSVPIRLRAALLAAWGTAYLQDGAALELAVSEVERDDEPHLWAPEPSAAPDEIGDGLTEMKAAGVSALRLALPAPGDPLGLTGPPEVNLVALAAGEAVVTVGGRLPSFLTSPDTGRVVVPTVTAFGTPGDQGHCVTWRAIAVPPATPDVPMLADADRQLAEAMREATTTLASLGTQSWRSSAQQTAAWLRESGRDLRLPDHLGVRADSLARRAIRVLTLLDTARDDDGGTVTAHLAQARSAALAPLDRAARRALVAAVSADHQYAARPSTAPVVPPR
jgi:hypothetical protein